MGAQGGSSWDLACLAESTLLLHHSLAVRLLCWLLGSTLLLAAAFNALAVERQCAFRALRFPRGGCRGGGCRFLARS